MANTFNVPPTPTREQIEAFRKEQHIPGPDLEPWAVEENMVLNYLCTLALEREVPPLGYVLVELDRLNAFTERLKALVEAGSCWRRGVADTAIEWTEKTWNPVRGCAIVSPGCTNCYAMKMAHRFSGKGKAYEGLTKLTNGGPVWTGEVKMIDTLEALALPIGWKKPQRIFVNSMSDLFHEDVREWFIDKVFAVMAMAPQHTFQILTKRPRRMLDYISEGGRASDIVQLVRQDELGYYCTRNQAPPITWPLPNVWLGVSVEDQKRADERIPLLLKVPAAVRWLSCEPLLGDVDLTLMGTLPKEEFPGYQMVWQRLNWIVVGGESGPGARPTVIGHIRNIVRQCKVARVPVFVKQLGRLPTNREGVPHPLDDAKGGDMLEWPEDLRIREYPDAA